MDRMTEAIIKRTARDTAESIFETLGERWVTAKTLTEECQMFTADWLERYGHLLPRRRVTIKNGRSTRWAYGLYVIKMMLADGRLDMIEVIE